MMIIRQNSYIHCSQDIAILAMIAHQLTDHEVTEQLLETLQELPDVVVRMEAWNGAWNRGVHEGRHQPDVVIIMSVSGNPVTLVVECKKSVFPRDVRALLWQLKEMGTHHEPSEYHAAPIPVLAAESISTGAKQLLRKARVGYFDTGGSLFLPAPGAYVFVDKPAPKALAKSVRSFFRGRRSHILHVMLHSPRAWFGVKELAEQAKVSPATASETLTALERFDWVTARGQGPTKKRALTEPGALLDAWSTQVAANPEQATRRYFVPSASADTLLDLVAKSCDARGAEYAVTYEAAAQLYAPFLSTVSQVRCRLQTGRAADAAIRDLDARVVSEGANLIIIETKSQGEFLFRERIGNAWLASPVQVYLDLLHGEGRAKEVAENLRRERIGF